MATIAVSGRLSGLPASAECAVAWGILGASSDGWTSCGREGLERNVKFAQGRIRGRKGATVMYGLHEDVHREWYDEVERQRQARRYDSVVC